MMTSQMNSTASRILAQRAASASRKNSDAVERRGWSPAVDLFETPEAYHVHMDLPGVRPEDVSITFDRATLSITGRREPVWHASSPDAAWRVYAAERVQGEFFRAIRLPEHVDATAIEAAFADGVLTITAPKSQTALPRRIPINGAASVND